MQTIEDFFRHIHPLSYFAFLHKASVIQGYLKGHADAAFIFALCGVTSQMMGSTLETQQQAAKWIKEAETVVLQSLGKPSILKIQVILLIIGYKVHIDAMSSAFMLLPLAARFAFAMRLNYENPSLCWLAQESRRRVMWAIFILDTKAAAGLAEFTTCALDTIHVQLPCREEDFELDNPQVTGSLKSISQQPPTSIGLFTQYIRIINIRDRILRFTKHAAGSGRIDSNPAQTVRDFEGELHLFASTLPQSLAFSERNLLLRAYSSELSQYIMVHIWWHQCHCDLYRLLFDGFREAISKRVLLSIDPELIAYCRSRCLDHARAIAADIFATLLAVEVDVKVVDKDISVCAYQSARILYQGLQPSAERSSILNETVLAQIGNCSAVLRKLCANFPAALDIAQEIDAKLGGQISSSSSLSGPSSPACSVMASSEPSAVQRKPRVRQVLSRHSFVRASGFTDDSSELVAPLNTMIAKRQEHVYAFSPSPSVLRDGHPQNPKSSGGNAGIGLSADTGNPNSVVFNTPLLPYASAEGSADPSAIVPRDGCESVVGGDWANDGAYQMAWSSFDPWISGTYHQDNWDVQDFMTGKWD
ncbi:uncharacterized protein A1O9_06030 [Exophiala aquamarina CBS 119918]|uniref:Xylanolytic transcriptional activator regulatory domain-containing protein n=1 Tax=Exophiala aquamarina CBS 119918 TaxID=1182545 RepID=A0A072PEA7_9EURO|nr:uncharacterized protein A1O9_06030 [Exophiala aquamarina CBS 119918]KEF58107.1 hypothetical protein A1O9_06030 [Exophiala aquamarina CBS 119918]